MSIMLQIYIIFIVYLTDYPIVVFYPIPLCVFSFINKKENQDHFINMFIYIKKKKNPSS
jgi:hypothetical protein